ncbi:C39 family peptidase [Patescibacteria group bacterium]|nr:C39 family peptidase [Patescibacteria group bacterium]
MKGKVCWLSLLIMAMVTFWLIGCDREEAGVVSPVEVEQVVASPSEQAEKAYPPYSFSLRVPFLTQVPPGDWLNTKNCGQTCAVMLGGYFNNSPVNSSQITAQNVWLANYTGNSCYNRANGCDTSIYRLKTLLEQKHKLRTSYPACSTLEQLINIVASGKPCVVGVMIKSGNLVSSGGYPHWAIVVGWNGNVIINDPGSSRGNHRSYSIAAFDASWATQGRTYFSVSR